MTRLDLSRQAKTEPLTDQGRASRLSGKFEGPTPPLHGKSIVSQGNCGLEVFKRGRGTIIGKNRSAYPTFQKSGSSGWMVDGALDGSY
jgi:hypothetical protein